MPQVIRFLIVGGSIVTTERVCAVPKEDEMGRVVEGLLHKIDGIHVHAHLNADGFLSHFPEQFADKSVESFGAVALNKQLPPVLAFDPCEGSTTGTE